MKKTLVILFVVLLLLVIGYAHDQFAWCKKLIFGEPTTHTIQKGEYLSEIAKKYYGRADYWRELALVNRSPNCDLIFPGEEIVIPSLNVIKEIRKTRWLSKVNAYMKNEEDIIARLNRGEEPVLAETTTETTPEMTAKTETTPEPNPIVTSTEQEQLPAETEEVEVQSASSLGLILGVIAVIFVASLVTFLIIRRKKRSQQITIADDEDINLLDADDEPEPDYKEYLRDKSKQKKEVFVN